MKANKRITGILALVLAVTLTGCMSSAQNTAEAEKAAPSTASSKSNYDGRTSFYTIVVDEETLIQYIRVTSGSTDAKVMGFTVRMKPDGTPYTINKEDLDKYEHFNFHTQTEESAS